MRPGCRKIEVVSMFQLAERKDSDDQSDSKICVRRFFESNELMPLTMNLRMETTDGRT
jgi:hypothetical protein